MPKKIDWNDRDLCLQQVRKSAINFKKIKGEFKDDKEFVMNVIPTNGFLLKHISDRLAQDHDITLEACKGYEQAHSLKYATDEMKDNDDTVYTICCECGDAFVHASNRLKNDKLFVLKLTKTPRGSCGILHARKDMLKDKTIIEQILRINGNMLDYFSDEVKNDYYYVSLAINNDPRSLQYASERLRSDKKLINTIFHEFVKYGGYFQYISDELKKDKQYIIHLINNGIDVYHYLSPDMKIDEDIIKALN
jgi:hypothetical protein